ncbi:MAG: hypothetical protein LQ339_008802 [Xanthoria mediterranea]|nr:MAG: hypothetical protein LQ339_008802 [Xanthoria mediterranea]
MIAKLTSQLWLLAPFLILTYAQDTESSSTSTRLTQPGINSNCNKFVRANNGDTCYDTAMANGITLAQLITWNPALGGADGSDCPTKFLAGYDYCVRGNGAGTTNPTSSALEPSSSSFTLEATNATFPAFHNGTTHITALNGSFYIGVDPARYSPTAITITGDDRASLAEESGGRPMFVATSSGALSYAVEEGEIPGEASERMEKGFRFVEGAFMRPGRGIFEFGVKLQDKFEARRWEACPTEDLQGMEGREQLLKVFAQGNERGKEGSEEKSARGEEEDCMKFLAVGTKTKGV